MKKYFNTFVIIFFSILLLSSCSSKIFFSTSMKLKLKENDLDINKVQFYNSKKIVLRKVMPYDSAVIANGKINFENGKLIDDIIIKKNTPATCEFIDEGILIMTFEQSADKYLKFKPAPSGNYYEFFISQDFRNYGQIFYDNKTYIVRPGGERSRLRVKKSQDFINRITQRVVKGSRVN